MSTRRRIRCPISPDAQRKESKPVRCIRQSPSGSQIVESLLGILRQVEKIKKNRDEAGFDRLRICTSDALRCDSLRRRRRSPGSPGAGGEEKKRERENTFADRWFEHEALLERLVALGGD